MELSQTLLSELLKTFSSQKNLSSVIKRKEIYKFDDFNINQIQKVFQLESQNIFSDSNSKKHLIKITDMIKNNFYNKKTSNYLNLFFPPSNNLETFEKRKLLLSSLKLNNLDSEKLKPIIRSIESFKKKVHLNLSLYTIDSSTVEILQEKYSLHCELLSKKELEQYMENSMFEKSSCLLTQEHIFIEIPTYTIEEFEKIIIGNLIKTNKIQVLNIIDFLDQIESEKDQLTKTINSISKLNFEITFDTKLLKEILLTQNQEILKELTNKALCLDEEVEKINKQIKELISKKQLSLQGDELLEILNSGDMSSLQEKFKQDTKQIIVEKEKSLLEDFKKAGLKINFLFSNSNYPLSIDEEIKNEILEKIDELSNKQELELQEKLGQFSFNQISSIINYIFFFDMLLGIKKFELKYSLIYPEFANEISISQGKNIYLENPSPVDYAIGTLEFKNNSFKGEKVAILTGANSGGKTTLLEMVLQMQILISLGLGIPASPNEPSKIKFFDEIIYLKKFTGTQGSGAFEQTIRQIVEILNRPTIKLILIDEFEAVTEPGAAAKILTNFLKEIKDQNSYCLAASHLGVEIKNFIEKEKIGGIRIDGISAQGLDENGHLITNHQPQFYTLGKSTPELILKRILQDEKFWKDKSDETRTILRKMI